MTVNCAYKQLQDDGYQHLPLPSYSRGEHAACTYICALLTTHLNEIVIPPSYLPPMPYFRVRNTVVSSTHSVFLQHNVALLKVQ